MPHKTHPLDEYCERVTACNCPGVDEYAHGWFIAYTTHRDADTVTQANWADFIEALLGRDPGRTPYVHRDADDNIDVELHRFGHWAVEWTEALIVRPDSEAAANVLDLHRRLEDYPVLDDERLSAIESEEIAEAWLNYGASDFRLRLHKVIDADADTLEDTINRLPTYALRDIFDAYGGDAYHTGTEVIFAFPTMTIDELRKAIAAVDKPF